MHSVTIQDLSLDFGSISVLKELNLKVRDGEFLVLLGASGCGKSTLLNCIAGLLDLSDGQIFIKGRNVTWEEPSKRGIGMVFQSYALYPQMTVEGNLSFGLRNAGIPRDEIRRRVARAAEILQIETLLKRKPAALSGGQRQRVAIGRALVREVDVFLFDEPLSNLDAKLRADLRVEIKRLHRRLGNTIIYVTHDQIEAMTLADRIAVMRDGAIQQLATPNEIYARPVNRHVADFVGSPTMNFVEGMIKGSRFHAGDVAIDVAEYPFVGRADGKVTLGIRPEHVRLGDAANSANIQARAQVELVEPMASEALVWTIFAETPLRIRTHDQITVAAGDNIHFGFNLASVSFFDQATEKRL